MKKRIEPADAGAGHDGGFRFKLALWVALSLVLLWPALINGSPLLFFDSISYLDQGRTASQGAVAKIAGLFATRDAAAPGAGFEAAAGSASFVRSITYAVFTYVTSLTPIGAFGAIVLQSVLMTWLIGLLVEPALWQRRAALAAAGLGLAVFTTLPWFVSYLTPDILAAALIVCGMVVVGGLDRLGGWARLGLLAAASFAMLSHYGNVPLGMAVAAVVLAMLMWRRRLTVLRALMIVLPIGIAIGGNMVASKVAFHEVSAAPKHLPILLARSIADGPALWHLQENCPQKRYAICELFDVVPANIGLLLWAKDGILNTATDEQMTRIRAEEPVILRRAFFEYPRQQTWSLVGNAVLQLGSIGTEDLRWSHLLRTADGGYAIGPGRFGQRAGLDAIARLNIVVTLLAVAVLLVCFARDRLNAVPQERDIVFVSLAGLAANAAIFGGLSAPVDRYQARVIWILPLLALLAVLRRRKLPS